MEHYSFWLDLLERITRNVLQTIGPILLALASTGKGINASGAALAVLAVVVFTALKGLAGFVAPADGDIGVQMLDRVGSAVAATLLAFLPEEALHSWSDWAAVDWKAVGLASLGAAGLALISFQTAPPALGRGSFDSTL